MPDEYGDFTEIEMLTTEISQLKQILTGVKTAKSTPDDARAKIATFCESRGNNDGFMKADPGMEEKNIFHNQAKGSSGGGGGEGGGGCCVVG